jgi:hypothetical protein
MTGATYDEAAHRVAAAEAREQYWRSLRHGKDATSAAVEAEYLYTESYERETGQDFPWEVFDSEEWPDIWEDEATEGGR